MKNYKLVWEKWLVWWSVVLLLGVGCGLSHAPEYGEAIPTDTVTTAVPIPTATPLTIDGTVTVVPLPPQLHLINLGEETLSVQQPAYLRLELAGTAVTDLSLQISQQIDDDGFQPVSRQPLLATLPPDGIHQWPLVWYGDGLGEDDTDETAVLSLSDQPFIGEGGDMVAPRYPLAPGRYRLTVSAQNELGNQAEASVDLTLTVADEPLPGRVYLDPQHHFQFRYPDTWQIPVYSDTLLLSRHLTTTGQMQLTHYPDLPPGTNPTALAEQIIEGFGPVSRLYQDHLPLAETRARRVVYGYTHHDGSQRTGVLLTFVRSGTGYVVDIEGEAVAERMIWDTAELVATSWQFVLPVDDVPPYWTRQTVARRSLAYPYDFSYQQLRDWHRFSRDRDTFWAFRLEDDIVVNPAELGRRLQDAAAGVVNFNTHPAYYFELGEQQWLRADFDYTNSRHERIQGAILLGVLDGRAALVWYEASFDQYDLLEGEQFLLMLVELARDGDR